MRLAILAVGRERDPHYRALFDEFARRCQPALVLREVEEKRAGPELKAREAKLLLDAIPTGARLVALDERGTVPGSREFADRLARWRDQGTQDLAFAIGGADGLDDSVRARADWLLAFGAMTWPHRLVRIMLAEQLYRAQTILAGHPYHRD